VAAEKPAGIVKALGRMDLILLMIVAIVNINNVPPVAIYGKASLLLWVLAFAAFLLPETVAVLTMARRYPGEGGIYLWTRKEFGDAHGFLAGWCYWTNNLFYIPVLLVYMAGIFAFGGGAASAHLVDQKLFVSGVAFGWLALIAVLNIRGLGVGKWIQNVGALGTALSIGLVLLAALAAWRAGVAETPPLVTEAGWGMAASFSVMCNAFIGIELASTMGDEIRHPERDLKPAILLAGGISLVSYLLVTAAVLALVPIRELGAVQGIMQAVSAGAADAGIGWIVAPVAIVLGLSIGGAASAWFAGSSRVPFVAGLDSALPAALGRIHPRWHSPYVALITCAVLAALFTAVSLVGSTVAEAYEVLLKSAVVIQLIPFIYLFLGLARLSDVSTGARAAGVVGLVTTVVGIGLAFLPGADVDSLPVFEAKMLVGVVGPTAIGWWLFKRAVRGGRGR
jgi:amino acid transporter